MKIILLNDVKKQGKAGDILNVKDGYGTFLINKGDAVLATSNSVDRLDREKKEKIKEEENLVKKCEILKSKIEKTNLSFKVKTGSNDKVFGSITAKQISEELKKQNYDIDKKTIKLNGPLDTLGYHFVDIELHKKVIAKIKVELKK